MGDAAVYPPQQLLGPCRTGGQQPPGCPRRCRQPLGRSLVSRASGRAGAELGPPLANLAHFFQARNLAASRISWRKEFPPLRASRADGPLPQGAGWLRRGVAAGFRGRCQALPRHPGGPRLAGYQCVGGRTKIALIKRRVWNSSSHLAAGAVPPRRPRLPPGKPGLRFLRCLDPAASHHKSKLSVELEGSRAPGSSLRALPSLPLEPCQHRGSRSSSMSCWDSWVVLE